MLYPAHPRKKQQQQTLEVEEEEDLLEESLQRTTMKTMTRKDRPPNPC